MLEGWQLRAKIYSDEFKRDAVALVNSGMSQRQVCEDMGISRSSLQNWVQKDRMDSRGIPLPEDVEERKEVAKALKRVRELEQENEVLRRAAAYLSQVHITPPK